MKDVRSRGRRSWPCSGPERSYSHVPLPSRALEQLTDAWSHLTTPAKPLVQSGVTDFTGRYVTSQKAAAQVTVRAESPWGWRDAPFAQPHLEPHSGSLLVSGGAALFCPSWALVARWNSDKRRCRGRSPSA